MEALVAPDNVPEFSEKKVENELMPAVEDFSNDDEDMGKSATAFA